MSDSFIIKDGAQIPGDSSNPDLQKKYSETFGTKLVAEKFTALKGPTPLPVPTVSNTLFINPCETKMLVCMTLFGDDTLDTGGLFLYASGSAGIAGRELTVIDFTETPLAAGQPMVIPFDQYLEIKPGDPVFVDASGIFSVDVTLELHEEFRWTD